MRSDSKPAREPRAAAAPAAAASAGGSRTFVEEARRAQLIDCAVQVLASDGYERASLARIAKAAGVSKGVISYHFDGKEELLQELVEQVSDQADAFMRPLIAAEANALGRLGTYIRANIAFLKDHREALAAMVGVMVHCPAPHPYRARHGRALSELEAMLTVGQRAGELGAFNPRVLAVAVRAAIDATPAQLDQEPDLDLDVYGDELASLFQRAAALPADSSLPGRATPPAGRARRSSS